MKIERVKCDGNFFFSRALQKGKHDTRGNGREKYHGPRER